MIWKWNEVNMPAARYGIYFAPEEESELERVCSSILGRCARTGNALPQPALAGIRPARFDELTAAPRHYGLHATLKAPFFLAPRTTEDDLLAAVADIAASRRAFDLPPLGLTAIGFFLALTPSAPCPELDTLARACVTDLDLFRRPPSPQELARRRANDLTPYQDRLLAQWGYPYVFDEFRFHLTLTHNIPNPHEREQVREALAPLLAPFAHQPVPVRAISIFHQPHPDAAFTIRRNFLLS